MLVQLVCFCNLTTDEAIDEATTTAVATTATASYRPLVTGPMSMSFPLKQIPFCSPPFVHFIRAVPVYRLHFASFTSDTTDWHQSINCSGGSNSSTDNYGLPKEHWHLPTGLNQCCNREVRSTHTPLRLPPAAFIARQMDWQP